MSLLSKLLGDSKKDLTSALDALKDAAQKAGVDALLNNAGSQAASGAQARPAQPAVHHAGQTRYAQPETAASGFSWGEEMPAEENQYNFQGTYLAYFDKVFSEEFPRFRITRETPKNSRNTAYYFWEGDRKAMVAELMSERSSANKLRKSCAAQGIPYVRFYYDHDGWWNTRAYVAQRSHAAFGR